jgi:hypothetical protein
MKMKSLVLAVAVAFTLVLAPIVRAEEAAAKAAPAAAAVAAEKAPAADAEKKDMNCDGDCKKCKGKKSCKHEKKKGCKHCDMHKHAEGEKAGHEQHEEKHEENHDEKK